MLIYKQVSTRSAKMQQTLRKHDCNKNDYMKNKTKNIVVKEKIYYCFLPCKLHQIHLFQSCSHVRNCLLL